MKYPLSFIVFLCIAMSCKNEGPKPTDLEPQIPQNAALVSGDSGALFVKEMIDALGGLDKYYSLEDAQYIYTYNDVSAGKKDVSLERYMYDGERSWARYREHTRSVYPDQEGEVIQGYDGTNSWVTLNGQLMTEEADLRRADFTRKTNFYWFNMMFKLLDPGTFYEVQPDRNVNGIDYKIVKVSFGENVGDAQDTYLLYIHPVTKLVDQFLFTVMDFGREEPLLMEVKYEEVQGLKWPTYRRYAPSDWEGNLAEEVSWIEEISTDLKFDTGMFDESLFVQPK